MAPMRALFPVLLTALAATAAGCEPRGPNVPTAPTAVATVEPIAPDAPPPSAEPTAAPSAPPPDAKRSKSQREYDYLARLHEAGDKRECRAEMAKIRAEWAADTDFSDSDLERIYASRDVHTDGPMPYPSAGTSCAIFGIQQILHGALNDRARARGDEPKYPDDDRPLTVDGE